MRQSGIEELKRRAEELGLNISDDALFVVSELRDELRNSRNLLLGVILFGFGILIGLGVALL